MSRPDRERKVCSRCGEALWWDDPIAGTPDGVVHARCLTGSPSATVEEFLVLLADDNEDSREIYSMYFRHKGLRVATAWNGDEALAIARAMKPAVIVMDLTMPGMDGWQATRALKADPDTRHIPIIALTGHAFRGSEQAARDAGCDRYLIKPCLPEQLLDVARDLFAQRQPPRRESA